MVTQLTIACSLIGTFFLLVLLLWRRRTLTRGRAETASANALKRSLLVVGDSLWRYDHQSATWQWEHPNDSMLQTRALSNEQALIPMLQIHPDDAAQIESRIQRFKSDRRAVIHAEFRLLDVHGRWRWVLLGGSWVQPKDGEATQAAGTLRDIDMLRRQADEDVLCGLGNRRAFTRALVQAIASRELTDISHSTPHITHSQEGLALLYVDLDKFKQVNDTLGHQFGDKVLVEVAGRLRKCLEAQGVPFRLGGDEFAVIVEGCPAAASTMLLASLCQRVLSAIKAPIEHDGMSLVMTASVGVARFPYDGRDIESLGRSADSAMYQAKRAGRNSFRLHRAGQGHADRDVLHLENALRRALPLGEFELVFQPRVNLRDRTFVGREALMRWRHPSWGTRPVESIVRTIESMDLIHEFGFWVIDAALASHTEIQEEFPAVRTSINVSGKQLQRADFPSRLKDLLHRHASDPSSIELELTESVLVTESEGVNSNLYALRALGVRLVVDDFGKGYSSLAYLRQLPISGVKIDKMFVDDIHRNQQSRQFIENLLALLEPLGLEITAEGIEQEAQLEILNQLGCPYGQGYIIGRPMSAHSELTWAREKVCLDSISATL